MTELRSRVQNGCTGCRYCMPCPAGVNIPGNFKVWNNYHMYRTYDHVKWSWEKELKEEQELIEQMKEIERQRAAAAAAAAAAAQGSVSTSFVPTASGYIWPVSSHTISSEFGYRTDPINGTTSYHSGLDIAASSGTPIAAIADGQVAWSYYSSSAGNWIGIDHGNGVYSVYMHCSLSAVSAGDVVSQGQTIGYVGSTGRSTGPHLHLSIRLNGEYVDPHQYVGY